MTRIFPLILAAFFLFPSLPPASASDRGGSGKSADAAPGRSEGIIPGMMFVSFYRKHLSAVDGDRCPSIPSCSAYSLNAMKKHGFFIGWMMTVDRLIHEGKGEAAVSPLVLSGGKWKIFDPVENNDFWWYPRKREDHE